MSQRELTVEARSETGKEAAKRLRRAGRIPAIVYGHTEAPVSFSLNTREFSDLVLHHGSHSLITLKGAGVTETVIIKLAQKHPAKGNFITVDFLRVSKDEKITAKVALHLDHEPLPVRTGEGVLVQTLHEIEIKAPSGSVPDVIHVDVAGLQIGDSLHVSDIVLPAGAIAVTSGDEIVASVSQSRVAPEEPVAAAPAPAA